MSLLQTQYIPTKCLSPDCAKEVKECSEPGCFGTGQIASLRGCGFYGCSHCNASGIEHGDHRAGCHNFGRTLDQWTVGLPQPITTIIPGNHHLTLVEPLANAS